MTTSLRATSLQCAISELAAMFGISDWQAVNLASRAAFRLPGDLHYSFSRSEAESWLHAHVR